MKLFNLRIDFRNVTIFKITVILKWRLFHGRKF